MVRGWEGSRCPCFGGKWAECVWGGGCCLREKMPDRDARTGDLCCHMGETEASLGWGGEELDSRRQARADAKKERAV